VGLTVHIKLRARITPMGYICKNIFREIRDESAATHINYKSNLFNWLTAMFIYIKPKVILLCTGTGMKS